MNSERNLQRTYYFDGIPTGWDAFDSQNFEYDENGVNIDINSTTYTTEYKNKETGKKTTESYKLMSNEMLPIASDLPDYCTVIKCWCGDFPNLIPAFKTTAGRWPTIGEVMECCRDCLNLSSPRKINDRIGLLTTLHLLGSPARKSVSKESKPDGNCSTAP